MLSNLGGSFNGSTASPRLPTAPVQAVTLNGGMAMPSWYDIRGLGERADEPCDGHPAVLADASGAWENMGSNVTTKM